MIQQDWFRIAAMQTMTDQERQERHGLVLSLWISFASMAVIFIHLGLSKDNWIFLSAGFVLFLVGFIGHIIVNAIAGTGFQTREAILGLFIFAVGILAFLISLIIGVEYSPANFITLFGGLVLILLTIIFYMITKHGLRESFDQFNIINSFNGSKSDVSSSRNKTESNHAGDQE